MKRLLDTNAYVALKRGDRRVADLVRNSESLAFSFFVAAELLFGFRNGSRYQRNAADLEAFLEQPYVHLQIPSWNTAERFGRLAAALRKAGMTIPSNDIWIAAQAFESDSEVVTLDRHFEQIPGLAVTVLERRTV